MDILNRADVQAAIARCGQSVVQDETGSEAERFSAELIEMMGEDEVAADWLFDNWETVLDACTAA